MAADANTYGPGQQDICQCGMVMSNQHLYECKLLNSFDKKVHFNTIFDRRLTEMQYIVKILEDNLIQFELTKAQNPSSLRH